MTTSRYEPGHHDFPVGLSVADPIFGEPARAERSKKKADGRLPKVRFSPFSSFCLFYLYFADCAGDVTEHTINFISFIPIGGLLHGATNQTTSVPSGHFQQILSKTKANSEASQTWQTAARAEIPVPASPTSGGRGYVSSSVVRRSRVSGAAGAPAGVAAPSGRGKYRRPGSHSKTSTPSRRSCGQPAGPTCIVTHRAWPSMYYTVLTLMYPQIRYPCCRRRSRPNNSLGICQLTGRRKKQGPWQFPRQGCCRDNRWI